MCFQPYDKFDIGLYDDGLASSSPGFFRFWYTNRSPYTRLPFSD